MRAMAIAVPVLRRRNDGKAQFRLPAANLFAALALLFSVVLLTQMGKGEFYVVGATCAIALLNWMFVRREKMTQTRTGDSFMHADEYGRALAKFSVNLLVRSVKKSCSSTATSWVSPCATPHSDFAALSCLAPILC